MGILNKDNASFQNLKLKILLENKCSERNKRKLTKFLEKRLYLCNELEASTAEKLLYRGYGNYVLKNLEAFSPDAHRQIAGYLFDSERDKVLLHYFNSMKQPSHRELAVCYARSWKPMTLIDNLEKFTELEIADFYDIINAIAKGDFPNTVLINIEVFPDIDHNVVLHRLIDTGMATLALLNLHGFKNINYGDLLKKLIDTGNSRHFVRNIKCHNLPEGWHIVNTSGTQSDTNIAGIYFKDDELNEQLAVLVGSETFLGKPEDVLAQLRTDYAIQTGNAPFSDFVRRANAPKDLGGIDSVVGFIKPGKIDWSNKYPHALSDLDIVEFENPNLDPAKGFGTL